MYIVHVYGEVGRAFKGLTGRSIRPSLWKSSWSLHALESDVFPGKQTKEDTSILSLSLFAASASFWLLLPREELRRARRTEVAPGYYSICYVAITLRPTHPSRPFNAALLTTLSLHLDFRRSISPGVVRPWRWSFRSGVH